MKKIVLLLVMSLGFKMAFTQEGRIIYTDFSPDTSMVFWAGNVLPNYNPDLFYVDFDRDGENEFYFIGNWDDIVTMMVGFHPVDLWGSFWQITPCDKGDVIADLQDGWRYTDQYFYQQNRPRTNALRHKVGEDFYYGWYEASVTWDPDDHTRATATLYKMAYCTIPNYPLRYGQTSLTDTDEYDAELFADISPNPTTGTIVITCLKPHRVELFNIQGQCITSQQSLDNSLSIDLGNLPAGLYFVNVTDEKGQKTVKKIVKQ